MVGEGGAGCAWGAVGSRQKRGCTVRRGAARKQQGPIGRKRQADWWDQRQPCFAATTPGRACVRLAWAAAAAAAARQPPPPPHLCVDVVVGTEHCQPWPLGRALHLHTQPISWRCQWRPRPIAHAAAQDSTRRQRRRTLLRMRLCRFSTDSRRVITRASTVNCRGRPAHWAVCCGLTLAQGVPLCGCPRGWRIAPLAPPNTYRCV